MSIANLSSENADGGGENGSEFDIVMKKPLQKIIGMQVLNVSVPLTYNVINSDVCQHGHRNDHLWWVEDNAASASAEFAATLTAGTYSADGLCREIERAMNAHRLPLIPTSRNADQRALHIKTKQFSIPIADHQARGIYNGNHIDKVKFSFIKPGMLIQERSASFPNPNKVQMVLRTGLTADNDQVMTTDTDDISGTTYPDIEEGSVKDLANAGGDFADSQSLYDLVWPGYLSFFDEEERRLVVADGGIGVRAAGAGSFSGYRGFHGLRFPTESTSGTVRGNSRRMMKTIGFNGDERIVNMSALIASLSTVVDKMTVAHDRYAKLGSVIVGNNVPEVSGPSLLFLRIGGDAILDQQNSETHMNDRIPIPIDQPHGGVVHYENDAEADVIPFAVPCDVRRLKFRLEYGDDNELVGGYTSNLRGHHLHMRLKFFKMHQQGGKKM